jgi:hypothetical protein
MVHQVPYSQYSQETINSWLTNNATDPWHYPNTDWVDLMLKKSTSNEQHMLSVSGGTEKLRTKSTLIIRRAMAITSTGPMSVMPAVSTTIIKSQTGLMRILTSTSQNQHQSLHHKSILFICLPGSALLHTQMGGRPLCRCEGRGQRTCSP